MSGAWSPRNCRSPTMKSLEQKASPPSGGFSGSLNGSPLVETDMTCQAFASWLTEMKARNSRTMQEMLSEMSIIRDGITSNNMDLTDFKRHSTGVSTQMQTQLTDLREKLTSAFGEITSLVKQKTQSDQEMMQDINKLQQSISTKASDLETLKRSYSQAHTQLQSSLIQIQNHLQVTNQEVQGARSSCDRVHRETNQRLAELANSLRTLEEDLTAGNGENRSQMLQLQEEVARIHDSLSSVGAEFSDHKRSSTQAHNKLQSHLWGIEEGFKRQQGVPDVGAASSHQQPPRPLPDESLVTAQLATVSCQQSYSTPAGKLPEAAKNPASLSVIAGSPGHPYAVFHPAGVAAAGTAPSPSHAVPSQLRPGSATLPAYSPPPTTSTVIAAVPRPAPASMVLAAGAPARPTPASYRPQPQPQAQQR